jgi:hypothetical protein
VELRDYALKLGFRHVESGPLVRSSYHAERQVSGFEMAAVHPFSPQPEDAAGPAVVSPPRPSTG